MSSIPTSVVIVKLQYSFLTLFRFRPLICDNYERFPLISMGKVAPDTCLKHGLHGGNGFEILKIVWQFFFNLTDNQTEAVRKNFGRDDFHDAYIPTINIRDPMS